MTTLALHAYRDTHGAYPERLQDLVPELLDTLPMDLADGQPLRYRRTDGGYLLYSVGYDGKDDGGQHADEYPAAWRESLDVVFSALRRRDVSP